MTYELVKELKDAGFSQEGFVLMLPGNVIASVSFDDPDDVVTGVTHPDGATVPTLSELIEACGAR